ncbi:Clan AD, family A22, presenilin-like aspartic peptidase [Trichomonas vaginalis G3]|uniref:Clan AD, family A22, presenilin-like aspartic peptidase n=1 Tax=Trichomonas vaginalis (strain ATCC PRA-98 / G3) TaxID=412133 RepID=A2G9L8_TRIV3|nr:presenilin family [Trichomonas vaginalis G3]EAX86148.1 Clan AD, family A22, presenilin-like aspartic peptidase [Trichomonas vaginalis G3]KAI5544770.1 presenilin family [Trichomonas vaginalis G3]|eukprot:XP_001299078.1 Clan AD, family A22, presenilin-like aspartic peptidase [Trichomonas vaginalis G3]
MPIKVTKHEFLEIYSKRIYKIAVPVILTLVIDVWLTRTLEEKFDNTALSTSFASVVSQSSGGVSTAVAIYIAIGFIVAIALVTGLLLLLYWFNCVKCIYVWMVVAVSLLLSYYVYLAVGKIPSLYNIPIDYIAVVIFLLNGVVVGGMSIFWRAPPIVTQAFMIWISVMTACVFLTLPDWTVWILLVLLIIWDCCVVLCPNGLLHLLIKKSQERGDAIPALVYSSAAFFWKEADDGEEQNEEGEDHENLDNYDEEYDSASEDESTDPDSSASSDDALPINPDEFVGLSNNPEDQPPPQPKPEQQPESELAQPAGEPTKPKKKRPNQDNQHGDPENPDKRKKKSGSAKSTPTSEGVKLGLGDFIFYGILVTRAARVGWDIAILDILAVMDGLALTLICLAYFERPLPALPFSLALGIIFYLIGAYTFRGFSTNLRKLVLVF